MFLMNAPPVLALQSTWEAFGRPGSCRFPGRLPQPGGAGRAAVSARVQMIISSLQGDRAAARGRSQERALHRGPRGREAQPAAASAACGLAAKFDPKQEEEEEAADAGPLGLDSDSDDSVDRDIEEAIQEYLKARSGAADGEGPPRKPEPPQSCAPPAPCAPRRAPASGGAPGSRAAGAGGAPGSASPLSVSSEDSFEQSIRAEIEQFLSEKRQHGAPRRDAPTDPQLDPGAARSCREPGIRAQRPESAGACREFVFRKPPRLAKAAAQPRSLRPKATPEPESWGGPRPAAPRPLAACRPAEAQSKGGARRNPGPGRRGQGPKGAAGATAPARQASDSSSDDGIEEAIRLYQRERRKEAGGDPPGEGPPEPPARGASLATRSALPDTPRKTPGRKKPVASKAADLGPGGPDAAQPPKPPKETKAPAPPGSAAARSESGDRAPCRADTSAELMCAEAILDISKTILPAPGEGGDGPPSCGPPPRAPRVPSRHCDGDSSSVDSDDSIEREIRTFLARKAQAGTPLAGTEPCPRTAQSPLLLPPLPPPPGLHGQASGPKAPASRTLDLSLGRSRKRRGGSAPVWSSTPKKASEAAKEGAPDGDPGQGRASEAPGREGEARAQPPPCRTVGPGDEPVAPDAARGGVPPSPGKAAECRSAEEKGSSEDKSSSLDSDEDLDAAIKDLLRSKRRLKKRCRDPRAASKKKVRFSTREARAPGQQGGAPQRGWKDRSPHLLKSCLSKADRDSREDPPRKPSGVFCSGTERAKPSGTGPPDTPPVPLLGRRACRGRGCPGHLHGAAASPSSRSEDSSSVDSDDSIELEIRKFLAEKAKESVSSLEAPGGGPTTLGPGSAPRPEPPGRKVAAVAPALALQPRVCTRSQRGRGTPQPAAWGPRGSPHAEQACLPAAPPRGQRAPPRSTSETPSARGPPAGRRNLHPRRDPSPRGAGPAAGDSAFGRPSSCAEVGAGAGSLGGTSPVTPRGGSTLTRSLGADREGGPPAGLALPWGDFAHQRRLQSAWAPSSDGGDAAWKGGPGGDREKGAEGPARGAPDLTGDPKKGLPFAGLSPLRPTQLFPFGNTVAWGAAPAGLFGPGLGPPLQGPSFSAFREAPAGPGPVFGGSHLLGKKEGGRWPRRRAPAALSFHGGGHSGSDEDVLDLRYRRRADRDLAQDPEAWGSDASELSDTSVEDGGPSMAPSKALKL
ncbi:protein phosphatase 1 regulatory subunit 26 [Phyllostomus hastatus]|uniref:protein phosphatase 1 regulatory subunit 26 n=1 Tax=Phyllostomus hastatus TaxID=9423 RepID=UPI001E6856F3|nr:protein phosphatase 1 regulatory subunit 26 [Phyllostomus hastatus]XP_045702299.1 protein phosphatase 1 regulatory subunit 26 [Phyllostomus hastatus]XP_045702300.1 protein phosphatase 1 regulatory subunit 26 [Phyllostomus hastatus]XP_045702302.1 protein phosphatase 1 regulatory subunit 26 [Phyllostomus hastatus]XP_045702303.1 protein phosphatase 1 regulatory subunit 26 [Phyllostomus hastatus]